MRRCYMCMTSNRILAAFEQMKCARHHRPSPIKPSKWNIKRKTSTDSICRNMKREHFISFFMHSRCHLAGEMLVNYIYVYGVPLILPFLVSQKLWPSRHKVHWVTRNRRISVKTANAIVWAADCERIRCDRTGANRSTTCRLNICNFRRTEYGLFSITVVSVDCNPVPIHTGHIVSICCFIWHDKGTANKNIFCTNLCAGTATHTQPARDWRPQHFASWLKATILAFVQSKLMWHR